MGTMSFWDVVEISFVEDRGSSGYRRSGDSGTQQCRWNCSVLLISQVHASDSWFRESIMQRHSKLYIFLLSLFERKTVVNVFFD